MKFGKRLHLSLEESLPQWRETFIDYKSLKKSLNLIPDSEDGLPLSIQYGCMMSNSGSKCAFARFSRQLREEEAGFFDLLNAERSKVNSFYMEKEEEFVIRMQEVKGRLQGLEGCCENERDDVVAMDKKMQVMNGRALVRLHGEMVLLVNYSALNYAGFAKILKKHDKRTGSLLRIPFMQSVIREPFFATEMVSTFVRECEDILRVLLASRSSSTGNPSSSSSPSQPPYDLPQENSDRNGPLMMQIPPRAAGQHDDHIVEGICKNIEAAWNMMKESRRRGSSTYNFFSFPPFGFTQAELDEDGLLTAAAGYGRGCDQSTPFYLQNFEPPTIEL